MLYVNDEPVDHHPAATDDEYDHSAVEATATELTDSSDGVARGLGIGALALSAVAVVLGVIALIGRRRRA